MNQKEQCPFCKSTTQKYLKKILSTANNKTYSLYECDNCALTYYSPLIFENIYSNYSIQWQENKNLDPINYWTKELVKYFKKHGPKLDNKKILDVGASDCASFFVLRDKFKIKSKNYYALDIDKKALQYGKAHGIKNTLNLRIDNHLPKKLQNNFDIVLATEVIEHQIDPQKFFTNIFKLLNSDGLLIITAPNKDRIFSRKREFPTDIPPHHFLKLSQKFFKKNFNLLYIKTFNDLDAGYKKTAKTISILLFKNKKYWLICIPIVPLAKIFRKVSKNHGTRLLVVIKKP